MNKMTLLAVAVLATTGVSSGAKANAGPPIIGGPPAVSSSPSGAGSVGAGPAIVGGAMAKVVAIEVTAWEVGTRECRQLSLPEVLMAPFPASAPKGAERAFLNAAWLYDQLPARKEALWMRLPMPYPSTAIMLAAAKKGGIADPCTKHRRRRHR
jgi:hypothetical protein